MPGPVERVEGSVVFRQVRIARIAKNRLHKIQVSYQATRCKKTGLKRALFANTPNSRHHFGPEQQRDKQPRPFLLRTGERYFHDGFRRGKCLSKQRGKHRLGDFFFVMRNRQSALHDMKHPLGGPAITPWIVQHTLLDPV